MIVAAIALLLSGQPAATAPAPDLSWLSGDWVACTGAERVDERWLPAGASGLVAAAVTHRGDRASFEFLRIAPHEGGWAYLASPGGRSPPTAFRWVAGAAGELTFEDPAHDFPQRIRYRRSGAAVDVFVGTLDGRGDSYVYRRPDAAGDCRP